MYRYTGLPVTQHRSYITLKVDRHVAQADEVLACSNVESSVVGLTKALQIEVGNGQRYIWNCANDGAFDPVIFRTR